MEMFSMSDNTARGFLWTSAWRKHRAICSWILSGRFVGVASGTYGFFQFCSLTLWHLTACSYQILAFHSQEDQIFCATNNLFWHSIHGCTACTEARGAPSFAETEAFVRIVCTSTGQYSAYLYRYVI